MAGSTSVDGFASNANGRSNVRLEPAQEAPADVQTLADGEQVAGLRDGSAQARLRAAEQRGCSGAPSTVNP